MTRTSAVTFTQKIKPFSEQFNRDMQNVISDLHEISQYLQPLQHLIKKADIAGEGGGTNAFPAKILQATKTVGVYLVKEVIRLPSAEHEGESRQGYACNLAEITPGPIQDAAWVGTGLSSECADGLIALGATISVEPILLDVVSCFEYEPAGPEQEKEEPGLAGDPLGTQEQPAFFFHHIIPICVGCLVGDDGDDGDDDGSGAVFSGGY